MTTAAPGGNPVMYFYLHDFNMNYFRRPERRMGG